MRPPAGTTLAGWFAVFTGYAVIVAVTTEDASGDWGLWAAAGYAAAAFAALRWHDSVVPLLIALAGAVAAPATGWPGSDEPGVVARGAVLLLHHGSPYLASGQLSSAESYNPYLPAMSLFGLPHAAGLPGVLGDPALWFAAVSAALVAAAFAIALPGRAWRGATGRSPAAISPVLGNPVLGNPVWRRPVLRNSVARNAALAVASPVLALPIALGTTDTPVIALMCLGLACAARPPERVAARWVAWTGLAGVTIGAACAMKATAWPALPVIAAMVAARNGARSAIRFTVAAVATTMVLIGGLAPALVGQPAAFADNIIAYPLGLARHLTPAASPLPGHVLTTFGGAGRLAAIALLVLAGLAVGLSLVTRPPRDTRSAGLRLALGLTLLFTLAPAGRFGYFAYPAALLGFLALTGQIRKPPGPRRGTPGPGDGVAAAADRASGAAGAAGPGVSRCRAPAGRPARPRPGPPRQPSARPAAPPGRPRREASGRA